MLEVMKEIGFLLLFFFIGAGLAGIYNLIIKYHEFKRKKWREKNEK